MTVGLKKSAAMCILKHQDQFLLLERDKMPNCGMFVPVGGKLEPYETPYQAALRETHEETGIVLPAAEFCGILIETSPTKYNWISSIYWAEINYQSPPNCNEGTLHWIAKKDLKNCPMPPTDMAIYDYFHQQKKFVFNAEYDAELKLTHLYEELHQVKFF